MTPTAVGVTFRLSWVNGWFIRAFARAFVSINGSEHAAGWAGETIVEVSPGMVEARAFLRYRGVRTALGTGAYRLEVTHGTTVHLVVRNGVMNQTPFTVAPAR
jgi:hypothetical protein